MVPPSLRLRRDRVSDLAHSLIEGEAENLDKQVDGVACQSALWPTPIAVFDEQALVSDQFKVAGGQFDELEAAVVNVVTGCKAGSFSLIGVFASSRAWFP
jgi:hypothetical protein